MKILIATESTKKLNLFPSYWQQIWFDDGKRLVSFSGAQIILNSFETGIVVLIRQDITVF